MGNLTSTVTLEDLFAQNPQTLVAVGTLAVLVLGTIYLVKSQTPPEEKLTWLDLNEKDFSPESEKIYNNLNESIKGDVITPQNTDAYNKARDRAFNKAAIGKPYVICQPEDKEDISTIIKYCNANQYEVAVFCGGHGQKCLPNDTVVIDMDRLREIDVNLEDMTVWLQGGCYLDEVDAACKPHNVAAVLGTYGKTGCGGLILNGGLGYLSRLYGSSVANLLEIEIVLANGDIVIANEDNEHSELFWGCRGGGGNFGIVTSFKMKIQKIPEKILAGEVVSLCPTQASGVHCMQNILKATKDSESEIAAMTVLPAGDKVIVNIVASFHDTLEINETPSIKTLQNCGGWVNVKNSVAPMSYHDDLQNITKPTIESGFWYTSFVRVPLDVDLDALGQALIEIQRFSTTPKIGVVICGYYDKGFSDDFPLSTPNCFGMVIDFKYDTEEEKKRGKIWNEYAKNRLAEVIGAPVQPSSHPHEDSKDYKPKKIYGDKLDRLQSVKDKYDPNNFFRNNVNIPPSKTN